MDSENFDVRIFAKPNRKVYIAVNTLNEKTFASTSPLLQPRKSVIRTTDYGVGKSSLTYFELCCQKTKVVRQKRNAKQDYELAGSRNYGLMELQSHGTTDLRNKGIESFFTFCTFLYLFVLYFLSFVVRQNITTLQKERHHIRLSQTTGF